MSVGGWWRGRGSRRAGAGAPGPRVLLYGREGCHLCAQARRVVQEVTSRTGDEVREVDVDAPDPADEPDGVPGALAARYGELVPVVVVDGRRHAVYHVDPARLEGALRRRAR